MIHNLEVRLVHFRTHLRYRRHDLVYLLQRHGAWRKTIQIYTADLLISSQSFRKGLQLVFFLFQLFPLHFPLFFTDDPSLFLADRCPFPTDRCFFPVIFIHVFIDFFPSSPKILKERPLCDQNHTKDHDHDHQYISTCHAKCRADQCAENPSGQSATASAGCTGFIKIQKISVCLIRIQSEFHYCADTDHQKDHCRSFHPCQRIVPVAQKKSHHQKKDHRKKISHKTEDAKKEPADGIPNKTADPEITDKQDHRKCQCTPEGHFFCDRKAEYMIVLFSVCIPAARILPTLGCGSTGSTSCGRSRRPFGRRLLFVCRFLVFCLFLCCHEYLLLQISYTIKWAMIARIPAAKQ